MRGKSITIDAYWFDLISKYAEEHHVSKKDALTMVLNLTAGRNDNGRFYKWYLNQIKSDS